MKGKPDLKRQNIICAILLIVLLTIFLISLILSIRLEDGPYHTGLFVSPLSIDETAGPPVPVAVNHMAVPLVPKHVPQPWTEPAKGVSCFVAPKSECLPLLGASWDLGCPITGYPDNIQYLGSIQSIINAQSSVPCSDPVALLNECDKGGLIALMT